MHWPEMQMSRLTIDACRSNYGVLRTVALVHSVHTCVPRPGRSFVCTSTLWKGPRGLFVVQRGRE